MKKFTLFLATLLLSSPLWAAVLRVNNTAGIDADFDDIQPAVNAASAGDTIYVEGSLVNYVVPSSSGIIIDKPLHLIGAGYFLDQGDTTQANNYPSKLIQSNSGSTIMQIRAGSGGTVVEGFDCSDDVILVSDTAVTIRKNNNLRVTLSSGSSSCTISQNYELRSLSRSGSTSVAIEDVVVRNNFMRGLSLRTNDTDVLVEHNVIYGNVSVYNAVYQNNIQHAGSFNSIIGGSVSSQVNNNIGTSTQYGTANGNQQSVSLASLFIGEVVGNSIDEQFRLASGSPAIGAANDGQDIGMYGDFFRYVPHGFPNIPTVYKLEASATGDASTPLNVTYGLKAR